jgi:hypothetical protein
MTRDKIKRLALDLIGIALVSAILILATDAILDQRDKRREDLEARLAKIEEQNDEQWKYLTRLSNDVTKVVDKLTQ